MVTEEIIWAKNVTKFDDFFEKRQIEDETWISDLRRWGIKIDFHNSGYPVPIGIR